MTETATDVLRWLVSLDDPDNDDRRTVTLDKIIERARAALATSTNEHADFGHIRAEIVLHQRRLAALRAEGAELLYHRGATGAAIRAWLVTQGAGDREATDLTMRLMGLRNVKTSVPR